MLGTLPEETVIGILIAVGAFLWFTLVFLFIIVLELGSIAKTLKMILLVIYDRDLPGMDAHVNGIRRKLAKKGSKRIRI